MNEDKKNSVDMSKLQCRIGIIVSVMCFTLIVIHLCHPEKVDEVIAILILLGFLPWSPLFFKKVKIGAFDTELHSREQGTTDKPIPPSPSAETKLPKELSTDAKRIMATLWRYQKQTFKDDPQKRWTFRILPHSSEYASFIIGFGQLLELGYVAATPPHGHCMLTNDGIEFIRNNPDLQKANDIYRF
jgi:hypothetical protein